MPVLKFPDPVTGEYVPLHFLARGDKGDKGDKGDPGTVGALSAISDVEGTDGAPVGKLLGVAAPGVWSPVDPPDLSSYVTEEFLSSTIAPYATVEYMEEYVDARIWTGTMAEYDAIPVKDPTVLYVVTA